MLSPYFAFGIRVYLGSNTLGPPYFSWKKEASQPKVTSMWQDSLSYLIAYDPTHQPSS